MRSSLAKFPYRASTTTASSITATYSTGSGRGRGHPSPFQFTVDNPSGNKPNNPNHADPSPPPHGHGHGRGRGRGKPLPSSPPLPSFSSFLNNDSKAPPLGRGRGFIPTNPTSPPPPRLTPPPNPSIPNAKKPMLFVNDEEAPDDPARSRAPSTLENTLPKDVVNVISGVGRGKPIKPPVAQPEKSKSENRHIRPPQQPKSPVASSDATEVDKNSPKKQLSQEEKKKKAMEILSKGETDGGRGRAAVRGGGRGGGRGVQGGRGRGRGRGRGEDRYEESDDEPAGLFLGDPADEEKLAKKLGPEVMNQLAEGFEEMTSRVLPSPLDDAYVDAYHTNLMIECEPEYLMEEFGTNPDIDEKPPIPLRDALEKMKPFLMAYEGIKSQEEWEEIMKETMKNVPLMKEIVDYYSGPDRVTAKQQQEELERVAQTLPASAPASVKRFTERAVLSLQSNPGWGFDKKCQFMDKLVMEVSQRYK